ncbi:MAG: hypothetical protein ACOYNS_12850 [Bacteroidota bacterium]
MKKFVLLIAVIFLSIPAFAQPVGSIMEYSGGIYFQKMSQTGGAKTKYTATIRPYFNVSSIGFLWRDLISESFVLGEHLAVALPAGFGSDGFNIGASFEFGGKFAYAFSDDIQAGFKHYIKDYRTTTSERVQMKTNYFHVRYQQHMVEVGFAAPKEGKVTTDADKYFGIEYRMIDGSIRKGETNYFYGLKLEKYQPNKGFSYAGIDNTLQVMVLFGWVM